MTELDPVRQDEDGTGRLDIPAAGLPKTELCRASSSSARPWSVSVGRLIMPGSSAPFPRVTVHVEWGHGRAVYATRVDPDQSFIVHGSFARLLVEAPAGFGGGSMTGQIVPSHGSASTATLTEFVHLISAGVTPLATVNIPPFCRWVQDCGGYQRFPIVPNGIELPPRRWVWETSALAFGESFQAAGVYAPVGVPQGASRLLLVLHDAGDPTSDYDTALTWSMALS